VNILLISQCNKRALDESRRILDQFAERKGERTWQTAITWQGLLTLRKLLRKTARRNTAVACHWIKSNGQSELLWIVGNLRRFNEQGGVPTNTTTHDILKSQDENNWHSIEAISLLASVAGLFHDFGKSNILFQNMLRGEKGTKFYQPYRHEWVSLRLFCSWVGQRDDISWLTALSQVSETDEPSMIENLYKDGQESKSENPFEKLPPVARVVAWLILSHHRIPVYPRKNGEGIHPNLEFCEHWLTNQFEASWNSLNHEMTSPSWTEKERQAQWQFPNGTPMRSHSWCTKAQKIAHRLLSQPAWLQQIDINQRFTCHMARLALMLADHFYSSQPATTGWQDPTYLPAANTDRTTGQLKQKLDEHNIGVAQNALLLARSLPGLRRSLPAITRHKGFKKRSEQQKYRWQDRAFDATLSLRERAEKQGFFGVNMASTGCGKTFANARIMYALADEKKGCRFSVALGLRTLTLQTGDALREKLTLQDDDLAVLIGSQATAQLHQLRIDETTSNAVGSESAASLFSEHQYVSYDGSLDDGRLSQWMKGSDRFHKLISAPVLVTTIDHLITATEGLRGGKQIAPMLRLLTSDLVLDEPDGFDINDLPALCRLVNWAGMLGSRVLLSSATLPPALVLALFNAYRNGWDEFQRACGQTESLPVCCAWFDENSAVTAELKQPLDYKSHHETFVSHRVEALLKTPVLRRAQLIPVSADDQDDVYQCVADRISTAMLSLHQRHHQVHPKSGKTASVGIVRIANINTLVAIARKLMSVPSEENYHIHYCIYHSQHPLAMRSWIEKRLDATLTRYHPENLWQVDEIDRALKQYKQQHHIFVVLATSVAEVGRDHDYDWAVAEPSSMRSLIQLAGRVQRHRQQSVEDDNFLILQQNIRSLKNPGGHQPVYCAPGFEDRRFMLASHDLSQILSEDQYNKISAIPRIQESNQPEKRPPFHNLANLEHQRLWIELQGNQGAALWWRQPVSWCGELQRLKPFRQSQPETLHFLLIEEEGDIPEFYFQDDGPLGRKKSGNFTTIDPHFAEGVSAWMLPDYQVIYLELAEKFDMELSVVSMRFGEISLIERQGQDNQWCFHPLFGVFREVN